MNIPENVTLYEHPIATFWFDEQGILYAVSKKGSRTAKVMEDYFNYVRTLVNNKPVCILSDISNASPMDKEARDYTTTQMYQVYKAMAILSASALGKTIGNVYTTIEPSLFPIRMFSDPAEAKKWLMQYCLNGNRL